MSTVSMVYDLIGRDNASRAFRSAGDSAAGLESRLGRLGIALTAAGAALAGTAAVFAEKSLKMAVDFQASMERIHTQAGASQKAVESLTTSVLAMAPSTQQGPQALADALYHLKSVGLDNAAAMKALRTASDLAAVGGSDLEETTNALAGAWRSGIKGAQLFGQTAATVNAIIGAGNMKMQDLVDAIGTGVLPAAKTFGVSLQSVGAALALMTDEGVPAVDAATRLKTSITLLGAPSAEAGKALKSIGVTGLQLADAMRGPQGIIGAIGLLKSHLDASGLSASKQAQVISKAFGGGHTGAAIMTLLNNFDVLEQKQRQINSTIGKYGGAVAAQRKTAQAQFVLLRSSIDTLGIRIGLDLLPPVTKFVSFLARTAVPGVEKFAGKVAGMLPVKQVEDGAAKIFGAVKSLLGIGGAKPVAVPYQMRLADGTPASLAVNGAQLGMSLTTGLAGVNWGKVLSGVIRGAVSGAQEIGAAFLELLGKIDWTSLGKQFATVAVGLAIGLVDQLPQALISEAIHHPLDMLVFITSLVPIGRVAGILTKLLGDIPLLGPLVKFLLKPIEAVGLVVERALGKVLGKIFGPVGRLIGGYFDDAKGWLVGKGEDILLGLWYGAEDGWRFVASWLGRINRMIAAPFKRAGSWLLDKGEDLLLGLARGAGVGWRTFTRWLGRIYGWVTGVFIKANVWLLLKGVDLLEGLLRGAVRGWRTVTGWLGRVNGWVVGIFGRAGRWLYDTGLHLIGGLKAGIVDAFRGIGHWVKSVIVDPLINWVKSWFGIHSPSTVMAWIGSHLMGGLFKGMMSHDLGGMVKLIFGSLPDALAAIVEKGLVSISGLPGKALSVLGSLFGFGGTGKLTGGGIGGMVADTLTMQLGEMMAASAGWVGAQWQALKALWTRESGWNPFARNPQSGAYGIPQALPANKMAAAGPDWLTNPATQIKWGLGYIGGRYGSPLAAWGHELAFGWYGHGGRFAAGQLIGVGERGPELAMFDRPGQILSPEQTAALYAAAARGGDGGEFTGTLYLDSGELLGIVRGEIRRDEKETIRAARSGAGRRR